MNTLLLADDEMWVRRGILSMLKRSGLLPNTVLEAEDGDQAIKLLQQTSPDLIITDIRMPFQDGLEIVRQAKRFCPSAQCIIITGFAEFEYAKQAIDLGVLGFLLKPVDINNLIDLVKKAEVVSEDFRLLQQAQKEICKSNQIQKELRLQEILFSRQSNSTLSLSKLCESANSSYGRLIAVNICVENINTTTDFAAQIREKSQDLCCRIKGKIEIENVFVIQDFNRTLHYAILICADDPQNLDQFCTRLEQELSDSLCQQHTRIFFGESEVFEQLNTCQYTNALDALDERFYTTNTNIFFAKKTCQLNKIDRTELSLPRLYLLRKNIEQHQYRKIGELLEELLCNVKKEYSFSSVYFRVVNEIIHIFKDNNLDFHNVFNEHMAADFLDHASSASETAKFLEESVERILFQNSQAENACSIVYDVRNYINFHYSEEIKVSSLADRFSVNANYLSTLFHRIFGKTISHYLLEIRMEHAKELLKHSSAKIAEIAESIGYRDPLYFCKVFKQENKMTPKEYREVSPNFSLHDNIT